VRTLERFVGTLLDRAGALPDGFVITFPKIVAVDHVEAFADVLGHLEAAYGLPAGRLRFEAQIETTPSVLGPDGRVVLRDIRDAAGGRLCAAHLGVYDYTAGLGLPATEQRPEHPACDLVRHLLQVTFAGTEVRLSDGSINVVPAGDDRDAVHAVWRRHTAAVRHALAHGYVQGWDLHASHLVSRYATVFADLLDGLDDALERLRRWDDRSGETGGDAGGVLDEPATIRRLEDHVQRAVDAGAIAPDEVHRRCGRDLAPRPATLVVVPSG
jgi:citrate lyase beta subunit